MPNLRNAEKALRQNKKRAERNKVVKAEIHSLRVKARKLIDTKRVKEAAEVVRMIGKKLDKAVQRNVLKKNAVARYKSRLMKKINALAKA
ncbi:30S ribosomal protein S20 [Candidatus Uhrbacteria bacterium]|nr:30S ribosomal protein S20 [Candidatus Uhrbacteria bacterium]